MVKLIMLKGLPASGKSTYAKKLAGDGYIRVNKDDLRAMLNNGKWSKLNEKRVLKVRNFIIEQALKNGESVVVDDTNFAPQHKECLTHIAKQYNANFETKFFDVSPEECIKRDLQRLNSVGSKVIMSMYDKYLKPNAIEYGYLNGRDEAIIVDIDGTLAHMVDRSPYDYSKVHTDKLDKVVAEIVNSQDCKVVVVSGREDSCMEVTKSWLKDNEVKFDEIYMRKTGDHRKDSIIKYGIYKKYIEPRYNIKFVLDDRNQVVDMWRNELGLKCLQVAKGNF